MEDTVSDYLKRRLISIDKVQADMFFPDRVKGECGLCGRECFGLFGVVPNTCTYCAREPIIRLGEGLERLAHNKEAVRWMEYRRDKWIPREGTKQTPLDGSSFTNKVIKVIPGKMAEHRNKAWG
jgi:hypothetical protein